MSILKVCQVGVPLLFLACEIDWLMTIAIRAPALLTTIDFPGLISIPDSPFAILDFKLLLKPFSDAPLE
jgi:hypothetical protein